MADVAGQADLRDEHISAIVTGFALQEYVMKDLCTIETSNSWTETYYQETAADLTAGATTSVEGIARLAQFPNGDVSLTRVQGRHKKHGMETTISYEDLKTNAVDVMMRSMLRIGRAVARSVDLNIWNTISENQSASTINSVAIAAGSEWNSTTIANRDPIQDILNAMRTIAVDNYKIYTVGKGSLLLSPTDYANLLGNANVRNAGQFWTDDPTRKGTVGMICGLKVRVSNTVTADYAGVCIDKEVATWQSVQGLTTVVIDYPGISKTIRSWEIGQCQLKNPNAMCLISNTQA